MTPRALRVGVVGANWGLAHIAAWRSVPGVELAAICTAHRESAQRIAREHVIPRGYWRIEEMLADATLDVVDVTPRPSVRAPIALEALAAGKHLLQPLPFALDLAQAAELERRALAAGVVASVENLHRHAPAFLAAKALIDEGFLGELYTVEGAVRTANLIDRPPDYPYPWIVEAGSGASALRNFGAHLLHVLTWLFGDVVAVAATIARNERALVFTDGSRKPNETEDTAFVLVRYAGGATGTIFASWCTPAAYGFALDASGSRGRLTIRATGLGPDGAVLAVAGRADRTLREIPIDDRFSALRTTLGGIPPGERGYPLAAMCYRFAEAIRTGEATAAGPSFTEAHRVMRSVEAAYEAAATHTWVATR